jgi:translation initiation factor IF-2
MSSKALADKLVEHGYDIKGHSSTVDEDTAARIRKDVLKDSDTEMVEKRISGNQGSTVIRRRSTVIRRKAKAGADDDSDDMHIEDEYHSSDDDEGTFTDEHVSSAENVDTDHTDEIEPVAEKKAPDSDASRSWNVARVISKPVQETTPVVEEVRPVESAPAEEVITKEEKSGETSILESEVVVEKNEVPVAVVTEKKAVHDVDTSSFAAEKAKPAKPAESAAQERPAKPEKKKVKSAPAPQRKGMARIVGSIDLPVPKEEAPSRPRKRPSRPAPAAGGAAARPARPAKPAAGGPPSPAAPGDDANRTKKRVKRGAEQAADDRNRRQPKGAKKGDKNVKYTHFGEDYQRGHGKRGKRGRAQRDRQNPPIAEMKASKRRIVVYETISVSELASRMRIKASEVIAKLMGLGVMATINQAVDVDTAMLIAADFGYEVEQGITEEIGIQMLEEAQEGGEVEARSPVVTVMGHVDHGKTSILDAIRKTDVAEGEAGGITQHIGAYHVRSSAGDVTFVDTPGHAAFTEMRSRGAQVTDLVILVVAADDGVMDQTREAINHAQAANVPILVAVNKIDKDNADPDRVKRELADYDLIPEEWGGDTMFCETSAKNNVGIDELMESIQLMAEILELKADKKRNAKGRVIEAKLDKGRGPVATVLVQEGTLKGGDYFVVGHHAGKVRALLDDRGRTITSAGPSIPVEVQGLSGVPQAGDEFVVVTDEKMAKNVSQVRAMKAREAELGASTKISLDKLFEKMSEGEVQELRVILRADVQGTLEAFAKAAEELSTKDIKVRVLHEGTGTITESDILLASASEAIIIGFNVRPTAKVKELAVKENVDVRSYDVIYHALDDIRKAMVGMLEPTYKENVIGTAIVRETFGVPKVGTIAGCSVMDGKIQRNAGVRVIRDGVVLFTGKISSLKRFKDDVKEVATGYECGIGVENYNDIKIDDHLEAFVMLEVEATLE